MSQMAVKGDMLEAQEGSRAVQCLGFGGMASSV